MYTVLEKTSHELTICIIIDIAHLIAHNIYYLGHRRGDIFSCTELSQW